MRLVYLPRMANIKSLPAVMRPCFIKDWRVLLSKVQERRVKSKIGANYHSVTQENRFAAVENDGPTRKNHSTTPENGSATPKNHSTPWEKAQANPGCT